MKTLFNLIRNPTALFGLIAFISFSALAAAFGSEAFLGLEPCPLCIYQRYPFAIGLMLGLIGLGLRHKHAIARALLGLCSVNFLVNSGIAFYHTGVEQEWWVSKVDGCAVTFMDDSSHQSILENIMSAPMGDCSEIPWQDPVLGLSMANYNVLLCFALFIFCAYVALKLRRQEPSTDS